MKSAGVKLSVAVGAAAFLAFAHGGPGGAKSTLLAVLPAPASTAAPAAPIPTSVPAAGSYTPATWAVTFLRVIGEPVTTCNVAAVTGWQHAEGNPNWYADHNPLDDELPEPGSTRINDTGNGTGVMKYVSWGEGLAATRFTIQHYPAVLAALRAGNNAQRVADAVAASPWGTEKFTVTC
jgi:hypothetical protein